MFNLTRVALAAAACLLASGCTPETLPSGKPTDVSSDVDASRPDGRAKDASSKDGSSTADAAMIASLPLSPPLTWPEPKGGSRLQLARWQTSDGAVSGAVWRDHTFGVQCIWLPA